MQLRKIQNYFMALSALIIMSSCNTAQSQSPRESLPGTEVLPGSKLIDASFFRPFSAEGMIYEIKNGRQSPFRKMSKEMRWVDSEGGRLIEQVLTYRDPKGDKVTGIHKTHYDPQTLQVVYWDYYKDGHKGQFAFKAEGTRLSGTQTPGQNNAKWQTVDLKVKLFQNETREMLFRSLRDVPVGTEVKFPIIGMQSPFHGWVAYKYNGDKGIMFNGRKFMAQVWQAAGNKDSYYHVIDQAPYVIARSLPTGKTSNHLFHYDTVSEF